jgi:hypothetical protein
MVLRILRGIIWNPKPTTRLVCSILINSVEYKTVVFYAKIDRLVTRGCNSAELHVRNYHGENNGVFQRGQVVQIFADYVGATTKIFEGTISSLAPDWQKRPAIIIKAVDYGNLALRKIVNKNYTTGTAIDVIFTALVSEYLPGYTTTNVNTVLDPLGNPITAAPTWVDKPLWNCFQDLMELTSSEYDFYCDWDKDWHVFYKGSVYNWNEAVMFGDNLRQITNEKFEDAVIYDKITVVGKNIEGIPIMYTSGSGNSEKVIRDTNLSTFEEVKAKADSQYAFLSTPEVSGTFQAMGMITLNAGDMIYFFAPWQDIQDDYIVYECAHEIINSGFKTTGRYTEKQRMLMTVPLIIKDRMVNEVSTRELENPGGMKYSWVLTFEDTSFISSFNNSQCADNYLQLVSPTTGTATSIIHTPDSNVDEVYLTASGDNIAGAAFDLSSDGGVSWNLSVPMQTIFTLPAPGQYLQLRVNINNSTTKVKAVGLMYNLA